MKELSEYIDEWIHERPDAITMRTFKALAIEKEKRVAKMELKFRTIKVIINNCSKEGFFDSDYALDLIDNEVSE